MSKRLAPFTILSVIAFFSSLSYPLCGFVSTILITVGLYEFFYMVEKKGVRLFKPLGLVLGALIPITIYFRFLVSEKLQFLFIVLGLFVLFLIELTKKDTHHAVLSLSATVFGVLYISWCFSFLIRIRQPPARRTRTGV